MILRQQDQILSSFLKKYFQHFNLLPFPLSLSLSVCVCRSATFLLLIPSFKLVSLLLFCEPRKFPFVKLQRFRRKRGERGEINYEGCNFLSLPLSPLFHLKIHGYTVPSSSGLIPLRFPFRILTLQESSSGKIPLAAVFRRGKIN